MPMDRQYDNKIKKLTTPFTHNCSEENTGTSSKEKTSNNMKNLDVHLSTLYNVFSITNYLSRVR